MNTKTVCAFAAGIVLGLLAASTSGLHVSGPSAEEAVAAERAQCAGLLAYQAAGKRRAGAEDAERLRQRLKERHGKDMLPPDYLPDKHIIDALDHMREAIEKGIAVP